MKGRTPLVAVLALIAAPASADIIHFVNPALGQPGHYDWRWEPVSGWESWLDITSPSTLQSNQISSSSVGQACNSSPGEPPSLNSSLGGAGLNRSQFAWGFFATTAYASGELIGFSTFGFATVAIHAQEMGPTSIVTTFPEGVRRYMGVRTGAGNYGWIEVERQGMNFTAFGWAYHTEPNVSIVAGVVPAPGAPAVIGLAFAVAGARRIRRPRSAH